MTHTTHFYSSQTHVVHLTIHHQCILHTSLNFFYNRPYHCYTSHEEVAQTLHGLQLVRGAYIAVTSGRFLIDRWCTLTQSGLRTNTSYLRLVQLPRCRDRQGETVHWAVAGLAKSPISRRIFPQSLSQSAPRYRLHLPKPACDGSKKLQHDNI